MAYMEGPCPICAWCRICAWRNKVLPENNDASPMAAEIYTPVHEMQRTGLLSELSTRMHAAMHEKPPPLWMHILRTQKLCAGLLLLEQERWFRFPTRNMRPLSPMSSPHHQTTTESITDHHGTVIYPEPDGTYILFHMVPTHHLVSAHKNAPGPWPGAHHCISCSDTTCARSERDCGIRPRL